jgi:hypothetical protein
VSPGNNVLTFSPAVAVTGSTLRTRGISTPPISTSTLLLDLYPNAAAAYSVRKLSSTYGGSAIRVRRSSDNAEQDIGFDATGNLDTAALLSFVGTGALDNGFVTTWYDQSGNSNNATQTTAINQPQIVRNGSILTNAGKPCLELDSTNDSLKTTLSIVRPYSIYAQFLQFDNSSKRMLNSNSTVNSLLSSARMANTVFTGGDIVSLAYASANQNVIIGLIESTTATSKFFYNLNNIATVLPASNDWGVLCFGSGNTFAESANGQIKETIVWATDQSANNTGIQTNINTYYGIY